MTENNGLTNILEKMERTKLEQKISIEQLKKLVQNVLCNFEEYSEKKLLFELNSKERLELTSKKNGVNSHEIRAKLIHNGYFNSGNYITTIKEVYELLEHSCTEKIKFVGKKEDTELNFFYTAETNTLKMEIKEI